MIALGVDPDLHHCGLAVVEDGRVVFVASATVPTKYKKAEAVVMMICDLYRQIENLDFKLKSGNKPEWQVVVGEGQQKYKGERARPEDLIKIAQVSGAAVGHGLALTPDGVGLMPLPREWKGTVPKPIHQGRILAGLSLPYRIIEGKGAIPIEPSRWRGGENMTDKQLLQVVDAIGLAQWGLAQIKAQERRQRRLAELDGS